MIFCTFFSYNGLIPRLELELLQSFQKSLFDHYPDHRFVVLTDRASAPQFKLRGYEPFAIPIDRNKLLLDRVRGFRMFLETLPKESYCAMLDFDMLVLKPFDFLDQDFETAYTLRIHLNKQPINGGVAVYRATQASKCILDQVISDYANLPSEQQAWWGDQISISNLFRNRLGNLTTGKHLFDGVPVLLLDAKKYNFTPFDMDVSPQGLAKNFFIDRPLSDWLDEPLDEKFILHFKGPRKHLQFQVNWLFENKQDYKAYLKREFLVHLPFFQSDGEKHLKQLLMEHPRLWEVNDYCLLGLLNHKKLFGESKPELRELFLAHLKKVGDFRGKIIGQENYSITHL